MILGPMSEPTPPAKPAASAESDPREQTVAGNYFVANYPPFSTWGTEQAALLAGRLQQPAPAEVPLGLYVHIPFCRKRCDFCYFRVYTDNDAQRVRRYTDALIAELKLYQDQARIAGRPLRFVYFGGGTPSYLSADQLRYLFGGLQAQLAWDDVEEVTFECEPGTLQENKVQALAELGVTRLSIGVENFDPELLALNNRAHRAKEIHRAYGWARAAGFPQINLDLIAGMVGESDANWAECIAETRRMAPESVTCYQMEVPYNTTIYRQMKDGEQEVAQVADWPTKRRWVDQLFRGLEADGYLIGSAYTAKKDASVQFLYRDGLWHGADLLGIGVASFSHLGGLHFQNAHDLDPYLEAVEAGRRPVYRAYDTSAEERLIREFILQLKIGRLDTGYFQEKFGVDVRQRFAEVLAGHASAGYLSVEGEEIVLSREGLLRIDSLLEPFFLAEHRQVRYA